jgi:hypothetical protein
MTSDHYPYESPTPKVATRVPVELTAAPGGWKLVIFATLVVAVCSPVPFANFAATGFLGWMTSRAWPQRARVIARYFSVVAGLFLTVLLVSGFSYDVTSLNEIHRWAGHGLVILVYLCVAFSLGILLHQKITGRPVLAVVQSLALLFCLAMTLSASFTGYLDADPVSDPIIAEETHNRFVVLHLVVQPTLLATLFEAWFFMFRAPRRLTEVLQQSCGDIV